MTIRSSASALLAWILVSSCLALEDRVPSTTWQAEAATKFVHRGMVQVDDDVLQGTFATSVPVQGEGVVGVHVFGNLDLHDDAGDAWFPGGNAGRFSEIDLTGSYARSFGEFDVTVGLSSYNVPNGEEFVLRAAASPRGSTTEVFATVATEVAGFVPQLEVHYDYDEVDGFYLNGSVARGWAIDERLTLIGTVALGWSDEDMSLWAYGVPLGRGGAGLADLEGSARLTYALDEHTTLSFLVAASTIVDDDIADWFDIVEIDDSPLWASLGIGWSF